MTEAVGRSPGAGDKDCRCDPEADHSTGEHEHLFGEMESVRRMLNTFARRLKANG
jgi:hypothetical protein